MTERLDVALPRARHGYDQDPIDADSLVTRAGALGRFVRSAAGVLDERRLAPARSLADHTVQRLAHSREHTVVALAGATGGGKSSLFNALSGLALSDVGVRRPTTGQPHACVWGGAGAGPLLDWLEVPAPLRFDRESALDAQDEATLRGLVLLDLPDLDSVVAEHRDEAERLLDLVDLVVWVTDPQKYADRLVHEQYLRAFGRHRDITIVVLNQVDRLAVPDVGRCVNDLRRLLDADGLGGVPVLATSAIGGSAGVVELRRELEKAMVARQARLRRLDGDLLKLVDDLSSTVGPPAAELGRGVVRAVTEELCSAAGAPAVANAVARARRYQARRVMGWPLTRYWRRRPDPLAWQYPERVPQTSGLAVPARAQRAAIEVAVRALADRASAGLPEPWTQALGTAARSRLGDLPDALDAAIDHVDLGASRTPAWWRVVSALQWLLTLAALAGVAWLIGRLFLPGLGGAARPALLAGVGLLGGALLSVLVAPLAAAGSRRASREAGGPIESAVAEIAGEYVIRPVRAMSTRYAEAREALEAAGR
ncbi:50S ribosome-binding GTPase [Rugosimonospora acidiphila]|uniref:50S ribosome-binding GTPase n=1 Tax=Rugosimonospora acidiphila TaxID=556531 RepID=A0ABP9RFY6_9ACTN